MVAPTDGGEPAYLRATRDGYDAIAVGYAERFRAELHRCSPDRVTDLLRRAGFRVDARLVREPDEAEKVLQAYLLAPKAPET
jgi:hypothetical protein